MDTNDDTTQATASERLTYIGPAGQESPLFGVLTPGAHYQADAALAAYLVAQHPEYWTCAVAEGVTAEGN